MGSACTARYPRITSTALSTDAGGCRTQLTRTVPAALAGTSDVQAAQRKVVALVDNAIWDTTPCGTITITAYVSQETKTQLALLKQSRQSDTNFAMSWEIFDYDAETKTWFPEFFSGAKFVDPLASITSGPHANSGQFDSGVTIDLDPTQAAANIDVQFYHAQFVLLPPKTVTQIVKATSSTNKAVKAWGGSC